MADRTATRRRRKPKPRKIRPKPWVQLFGMPPLSHWPDRKRPFSDARSEVVAYVCRVCGVRLGEGVRIFGLARFHMAVVFDRKTKLWHGTWPGLDDAGGAP